ncbi:TPA: hypothetical protein ACH3X3_004988 [Trebouxia sp. C0006]
MRTPSMIRTHDVQGLLLWVLADGMSPRWCFVKNKALVSKIVMIAIPGLEAELFTAKQEFMPIMHSQLATPATVIAKSAQVTTGSTLAALFTVPLSKKRKRESDQQQQQQKRQAPNGTHKPFPPSHYRVTLQQMESNDYPMPVVDKQGIMTCPTAYVATQPAGGKDPLEMVSVDCEMCVTAAGYELTRVSLVDGSGQVLLDELVLPDNAITDYNTQYSGITAQALAGVTTRLTDIQRQVSEFVSAETLLVGHGLENDLRALKIIHANCLDTVMLFPHPKGPPAKPALRFLADKYLKRKIQVAEHDSVVDARAALDLVKLKIAKGPAYGTISQHEEQGDRLMDVLHAHDRRCTLIDRTDMLNRHVTAGASAVVVKEDGEAVCKTCKEAANEKTDFVWTQLRALGTFLGMRAQHKKQHPAPLQQTQQQPQQKAQQAQQPNGSHAMEPQNEGTSSPLQRNHSDAMDQNVAEEVDGAMDIARANGNGSTGDGGGGRDGGGGDGGGGVQQDKATHEQAASTKEEHTEEHKVVKTDQDKAGNQQAKAEVVHKTTTTKVKKRKRVEQTSAGSGNGDVAQAGASPSSADEAMPDATKQSCRDAAGEEMGAQDGPGNAEAHQNGAPDTAPAEQESPAAQSASAASPAPAASPPPLPQEFSEQQLNCVLKTLDESVGQMIEALPVNAMLVLYTCQGDTVQFRMMQEQKMKRQQGVDSLPPWTLVNETEFSSLASRVCRALCFASVKQ